MLGARFLKETVRRFSRFDSFPRALPVAGAAKSQQRPPARELLSCVLVAGIGGLLDYQSGGPQLFRSRRWWIPPWP